MKMNRTGIEPWIDWVILFCFCVFIFFLPIAYTETIRAFSLFLPVALWAVKMALRRRWLIEATPLDIPILLFSLIIALSLTTAVDFKYSLDELIGEWIPGILIFYLGANLIGKAQMKYILGALLAGNLLMVGFGIYYFFHQGGGFFDYRVRAGSLHSGFGTFSTYLITVLPYLLVAFYFLRRVWIRAAIMALLLLNFFALYLTYSRGAWIAAAVLLILIGFKFIPKKLLMPAAVMAILAGVGFYILAPTTIIWHYTPLTSGSSSGASLETSRARWELTKFSLEKIKENPFQMLGYGRRSFVKKYNEFYLRYKGAQLWHAHNTFLNIALQTGIQGLAFFGFLLYKLLKYLYVRGKLLKNQFVRYFLSATFYMILVFFTRNLSDDFFIDDSALLFWFLTGAAISLGKNEKE